MGNTMFYLSVMVAAVFGVGAVLMFISDTVVDWYNRSLAVDDVPAFPSQRAGAWVAAEATFPPGGPARCPICLETQALPSMWIRAHGQLVCRPCARLSPGEANLIRSHQDTHR